MPSAPVGSPTESRQATHGGPLSGLLVADLSRVLAGPFSTQILADFGATVIKVESPDGDETRHWTPPERDGVSTYYLGVNRNKQSLVLDFRRDEDRALAQELTRRADVVVENFRPGSLAKFGLDYASVRDVNPSTVYASISGFGSAEGARLPGYDLVVQAASGLMSLTGDADGEPFRSGVSVFDVMTGMQATVGILLALRHRDATGQGQHVEVNLLSTALSAMANHTTAYVAGDTVPFRMGNGHPSLFPYEPLPTADGQIIVVAANDQQFARLTDALGVPELQQDPRFATSDGRNRLRRELRPLLVAALATRSTEDWFRILTDAQVACGPINDIAGGVALADRLGLEPVIEVGPENLPLIRNAITLSETPATYRSAPPELGADSESLVTWLQTPEAS